jgi:hypothetical protein
MSDDSRLQRDGAVSVRAFLPDGLFRQVVKRPRPCLLRGADSFSRLGPEVLYICRRHGVLDLVFAGGSHLSGLDGTPVRPRLLTIDDI